MNPEAQRQTLVQAQSFLLADHVYRDMQTGKFIIAGTFDRLMSPQFPSVYSRPTYAYLRLLECHGPCNLQLRFVDLDNDELLLKSPKIEFEESDPNRSREMVIEVPQIPMPRPGWYELGAYCNETLVGRIRLRIEEAPQRPGVAGNGSGE